MQRRQFCKSLAMAAASTALPSYGRSSPGGQSGLPPGFNQYTQDYAAFCALPPEKRVFYKVDGGKIVETKLDESNWQQPLWNYTPAPSRIAGGMWDDVPLLARV
jgi:alpha-L-fucosidase